MVSGCSSRGSLGTATDCGEDDADDDGAGGDDDADDDEGADADADADEDGVCVGGGEG